MIMFLVLALAVAAGDWELWRTTRKLEERLNDLEAKAIERELVQARKRDPRLPLSAKEQRENERGLQWARETVAAAERERG